MQIMPTSRTDAIFGFSASKDDGGFFDVMQDAMTAVANGENVNVDSAMADAPLVEAPYSRHTTDGVTYTLSEVCFTKNELAELRQLLVKEGAPEETLKHFDILASQPDGATLAQVLASLMQSVGAGNYTDQDAHAITALLGQIDATGTLAGDALGFMSQGNGMAALELIRDAAGKLASGQSIEVDPASLLSLGRAMGLNQDTLNQLGNMLGGRTLRIDGSQFVALMEPAQGQFLTDAANNEKLQAAIDKTLKPIISKARARMEKEQEATQRESRRVQQSRILIDQTVQRNSRETLDETVAGQGSHEAARASGMVGQAGTERVDAAQTRLAGQPLGQKEASGQKEKGQSILADKTGEIKAAQSENAKVAVNAHDPEQHTGKEKDSSLFDQNRGKEGAWQDLLGRVDVKQAAPAANPASFVYSMLEGNLENQIFNMDQQLDQTMSQHLNQQLAQQVERGLLTAMKDGGTRMDLQLHPAELGTLTITLIARNGEVTAQLKSEKTETAELLTRQLDMIKVNLENQGLKVDKIEVQLQNQQDNQFADLGGHNSWQEENARRQEMTRLRNLAGLRASQDTDTNLAQGLHNSGKSARYAGQALHVVA